MPRSCSMVGSEPSDDRGEARTMAFAKGLRVVEDEGLLKRRRDWSNGQWC